MSPESQGYVYKNGAYYKISDGTGPYTYDGVSTFTLLTWATGATQAGLGGVQFKDRGYHKQSDAEGPMSVS